MHYVSKPPASGARSTFHQLTDTYLKARWYMGAGLIALTVLLANVGEIGPEIWAVAGAGAVILAHAFAMRLWDVNDATVALLLDATATAAAAMLISLASGDHLPVVLTFVIAATIISLFTEQRIRLMFLIYISVLTLASMLIVEDWKFVSVVDEFMFSLFAAGLISGVISVIRTRLMEVDASRAQTIGVVSHELRNHLTGVVGAIDLVTDDDSQLEPGEANELLQLALQQAMEAEEVIEDLLIASHAERGVLDAIIEVVDLCPLTEVVIRRTSVEDSNIVYDFSHGPVWAKTDPLRYKQIVRNLLTNAQRYGGDTVRVSIEKVDDTVSVAVVDNGEGIDAAEVSNLFLPYRGGQNSQGVSGSSGLGLWIARSLAHKMNGQLVYERRSGQTVFELSLPAAPEGATNHELEPSLSSSRS